MGYINVWLASTPQLTDNQKMSNFCAWTTIHHWRYWWLLRLNQFQRKTWRVQEDSSLQGASESKYHVWTALHIPENNIPISPAPVRCLPRVPQQQAQQPILLEILGAIIFPLHVTTSLPIMETNSNMSPWDQLALGHTWMEIAQIIVYYFTA